MTWLRRPWGWGGAQVEEFVGGLLDPSKDTAAFQTLARDFLIQLKEFNSDQWTESSLSLQLEMQHKEAEKMQVPPTHTWRGGGGGTLCVSPAPAGQLVRSL